MRHCVSIIYLVIAIVFLSCQKRSDKEGLEILNLTRVDHFVRDFAGKTLSEQDSLLMKMGSEVKSYLKLMGMEYPSREQVEALSQSDMVKTFQTDVDKYYPSIDAVDDCLCHILQKAKLYDLDIPELNVALIVWGFNQPIVCIDSIIFIALNHYLGEDYPGYSHWEAYQRQVKTPEHLPYDMAEAILKTKYPFQKKEDNCLLNEMLYEGAIANAMERLVPNASPHSLLGYTNRQFEWLEANEEGLWREMAMAKMVYDSNCLTIEKMMLPGPFSPLMKNEAPGRAGRYIGYKIVKSYTQKHPGTKMEDTLTPDFYNNSQTLINSGF